MGNERETGLADEDRDNLIEGLLSRLKPVRAVYPLYLASRANRGLQAALSDEEGIIESVGEIQSLGNSRYAIPVVDTNGATYRITIEHIADYDGPTDDQIYNGPGIEGGVRYRP